MLMSYIPFNRKINPFYNFMDYQRNYTIDQIELIYNEDYINFNLKNILHHPEGFEYKWIPIKDLNLDVDTISFDWNSSHDPYAKECNNNKLIFAEELINKGTYFPIIITKEDTGYYVWEGQHRIQALKIAVANNLISQNYELLCIIVSSGLIASQRMNKKLIPNKNPIEGRFIIEQKYSSDLLIDKEYNKQVQKYLKEKNFKMINDYTVQEFTTDRVEMYNYLTYYPLFLRDLFFKYKNIQPSKIINNKEAFEKWMQKD